MVPSDEGALMVGLKRLFNAGASPRSGSNTPGAFTSQDLNPLSSINDGNDVSCASSVGPSTPGATSTFSPNLKHTTLSDVNEHFLGIERQFEQLHEQFHSRPLSSLSHLRYSASNSVTARAPRHVDVVEALFSSHRYQIRSRSLSPIIPYNEDIADRNLHSAVSPKPKRSPYTRIVSAIYQEDVADRNIARLRSNASFHSSLASNQAWESEPGIGYVPKQQGSTRRNQLTVKKWMREQHGAPRTSSSHENLSHVPRAAGDSFVTRFAQEVQKNLRPQVSAPDLLREHEFPRSSGSPWADSPTLGAQSTELEIKDESTNFNGVQPIDEGFNKTQPQKSAELGPSIPIRHANQRSPSQPNLRKNVRDLSINTELTSFQKPAIKVEHHTSRQPVPSHRVIAQNASIAEIVNSPLPAASPSTLTPQLTPSYNVEEIMNMFKQAYITIQATSPHHPTFETLQDAIIREINSHDAFLRVPVPDTGPPFTPPASQESFDKEILLPPPGPSRTVRSSSEKESQFSRLIHRGSSLRRRGKSIPSTYNIKASDRTSKRRHTYAQPPSTEWIQGIQSSEGGSPSPLSEDSPSDGHRQRPFFKKTHLKRKSDPVPPSPGFGIQPDYLPSQLQVPHPNHPYHQQYENPGMTWRNENEVPCNGQIRAIDNNNVMYILNATQPLTPSELINASQQVNRRRRIADTIDNRRSRGIFPYRMNNRPVPLRQSSLYRDQPDV